MKKRDYVLFGIEGILDMLSKKPNIKELEKEANRIGLEYSGDSRVTKISMIRLRAVRLKKKLKENLSLFNEEINITHINPLISIDPKNLEETLKEVRVKRAKKKNKIKLPKTLTRAKEDLLKHKELSGYWIGHSISKKTIKLLNTLKRQGILETEINKLKNKYE